MQKRIKNKTKTIISILLVAAVVITGAFAYLFMTNSKTNVFTIGNVDIKLNEEFDTNLNGKIDAGETYSTSRKDITIEADDVIVPGQIITKRPYIENTGTAAAWVYVTVGIPTSTDDEILMENGEVALSGKDINIPVKAYAIQDGYGHQSGYKDIWNAYFDESAQKIAFGEKEVSDANLSERVALFKILNKNNKNLDTDDIVNEPNSDWESIGYLNGTTQETVYKSANGYNYYVFAYKTILSADTNNNNNNISSKAFEGVKLVDGIGEIKPVKLEYYLNNDDFELVRTDYCTPGEIIEELYYDDSFAKNEMSFDWYNEEEFEEEETRTPVSAGFQITEDLTLVGDWTPIENNAPLSDYLTYRLYYDKATDNVYAAIIGADTRHEQYRNRYGDSEDVSVNIVTPSMITVTKTERGVNIAEGSFVSADETTLSKLELNIPQTVYVKRIEGSSSEMYTNAMRKIVKSVFIGDNVTYVGSLFANSNKLESVSLSNTVKTCDGSFENCTKLTEIKFPSMFTEVGANVCKGCTSLKTITLDGGIQTVDASAFANCTSLETIEMSDRVRTIDDSAFAGCSALKTLNVGNGVTCFGSGVLGYCHNVDIKYNGNLTDWCRINDLNIMSNHKDLYINNKLVEGELAIPVTVKTIPRYAFFGCADLTSITIGSNVTNIGSRAFENCTGLTSIVIPGNVQDIGYKAFYNNTNAKSLTIQDGVKTIGREAFANIGIDDKLTIPESITSLGQWCFCGMRKLNTLEMLSNCQFSSNEAFEENQDRAELTYKGKLTVNKYSIGSAVEEYQKPCSIVANEYYVYDNNPNYASDDKMLYTKDMTTLVKAPKNTAGDMIIKDGVKTIEASAFSQCSISSVTLPDSATTINALAFNACAKLKTISLGKNVETIEDSAFARTDGMQSYIMDTANNQYCTKDGVLYDKNVTKVIAFPAARTEYEMPDTITELAISAFQHSCLTSIELSEKLTVIPKWCFQNCPELTSIHIPASVTSIGYQAFQKNILLAEVTGGENVKSIEHQAFNDCSSLLGFPTSFTSVESIAYQAFVNCKKLTTAIFPESLTTMDDYAFQGCNALKTLVLPENLTNVGADCFLWCSGLTDVTIKGPVIGSVMFKGCTSLETITIPKSVKSMGWGCFQSCTSLKNVIIEDGVPYLGQTLFEGCTALEEMVVPSSVTSSKGNVFAGCTNLKKATINGQLQINNGGMFERCNNLQEVIFGSTLGTIGNWLCDHPNVTSVTIENGVNKVQSSAFEGCSRLTEITIPDSVTYIGQFAFKNCAGLTTITLPKNVNAINSNTFAFCENLTKINIENANLSEIKDNAFANLVQNTTINFNGTIEQWKQLVKDRTYYLLGFLTNNAQIVCTNGTVTCTGTNGNFAYSSKVTG